MADDVVADVFLVAWRRLDDVPPEPLPWLLGVARRVVANRRRGAARDVALVTRLQCEPIAPADSGAVADDPAVFQALERVSERDRELLLLVAWDGLGREQAAAVLGISPGTFAVRLHRARRRFARALAAQDERASDECEHPEALEAR